MIMNAAVRTLLSASPIDEIVVCSQSDYYNEQKPRELKVKDIIKENGKVVILTEDYAD